MPRGLDQYGQVKYALFCTYRCAGRLCNYYDHNGYGDAFVDYTCQQAKPLCGTMPSHCMFTLLTIQERVN